MFFKMKQIIWDIRGYPGGGKTTLVSELLRKFPNTITTIPRVTTRPKRVSDTEWEYVYLSPAKYRVWEEQGKILCSTEHIVNGVCHKSGIIHPDHWVVAENQIQICVLGSKVTEAQKLRPQIKTVFIDCELEVLRNQLQKRCLKDGSSFEEKWMRVQRDMNDKISQHCDFVIYNNNTIEALVAQFLELLKK